MVPVPYRVVLERRKPEIFSSSTFDFLTSATLRAFSRSISRHLCKYRSFTALEEVFFGRLEYFKSLSFIGLYLFLVGVYLKRKKAASAANGSAAPAGFAAGLVAGLVPDPLPWPVLLCGVPYP